jgi:hypothetical protein
VSGTRCGLGSAHDMREAQPGAWFQFFYRRQRRKTKGFQKSKMTTSGTLFIHRLHRLTQMIFQDLWRRNLRDLSKSVDDANLVRIREIRVSDSRFSKKEKNGGASSASLCSWRGDLARSQGVAEAPPSTARCRSGFNASKGSTWRSHPFHLCNPWFKSPVRDC